MQYKIYAKLVRPASRVVVEVDDPVPAGVGADFAGPVTGSLELTNAGSVVSARGHLRATLLQECSRCLARHQVELAVEVCEECRLAQIEEPSAGRDAQSIPILDGDMVDLTELVRQAMAVQVPIRSLCREDCQGLCPQCGRNLNHGACSCPPTGPDPRWAGLAALRGERRT